MNWCWTIRLLGGRLARTFLTILDDHIFCWLQYRVSLIGWQQIIGMLRRIIRRFLVMGLIRGFGHRIFWCRWTCLDIGLWLLTKLGSIWGFCRWGRRLWIFHQISRFFVEFLCFRLGCQGVWYLSRFLSWPQCSCCPFHIITCPVWWITINHQNGR